MKTKGWGPWRADWYSICSAHRDHNPNCDLCDTGHWQNRWTHAIDGAFYRFAYPLWYWWHNRPNSAARRRLEGWFPGLKGDRD